MMVTPPPQYALLPEIVLLRMVGATVAAGPSPMNTPPPLSSESLFDIVEFVIVMFPVPERTAAVVARMVAVDGAVFDAEAVVRIDADRLSRRRSCPR